MRGAAYLLGALDALVKAGEVSPAYAAGAASVLSKEAGVFSDDPADYLNEIRSYIKKNPGKFDRSTGRFKAMTPGDAVAIVDGAMPWSTKAKKVLFRAGNLAHQLEVALNPFDHTRIESVERAWTDRSNRYRRDFLANIAAEGAAIHPEIAGAVQDKHVHDARVFYLDRQADKRRREREMRAGRLADEEYAREKARDGWNPSRPLRDIPAAPGGEVDPAADYEDTFRTPSGNAAIQHGYYTPKWDKSQPAEPTPGSPRYGVGLPKIYGGNKDLFYRHEYVSPFKHLGR